MRDAHSWPAFRLLIPQLVTASRIAFSAAAILFALAHAHTTSARLIVGGAITDLLDGPIATHLRAATAFGGLFDYFADYLCYVVAPVVLCYTVVSTGAPAWSLVLLSLPLLTGAIRYARNGSLLQVEEFEKAGYPGLGTNFYAMFVVGATLLSDGARLGPARLDYILSAATLVFSLLMVLKARYPKLTVSTPLAGAVLLYLVLVAVLAAKILAAGMLTIVVAYTLISPLLARQRTGSRARAATGLR